MNNYDHRKFIQKNKHNIKNSPLFAGLLVFALISCGTWVGNPAGGDGNGDGGGDKTDAAPTTVGSVGSQSGSQKNIALPGDVFMQKISLKKAQPFKGIPKFKVGASLVANDVQNSGPFEISVIASDGKEINYTRTGINDASIDITPANDGDATVLIKNNTSASTTLDGLTVDGGTTNGNAVTGANRADAPYKDILMKSVIAFARTCKSFANNGANTYEVKAKEGSYFAQPFVFLGKVDANKKVTPISTSNITLKVGAQSMTLTKISDFPADVLSDYELPKDADVVRMFYQGYFGAAGELYTTDTFLFGGDCDKAVQFALGTDVGTAKIFLNIKDNSVSPAIDVSFPIRATVSTSFTMYTSTDEKLTDYTQCTIDRVTAQPTTYNGDATTCKKFSFADPPYVKLDYKPSDSLPGITKDSDPNRVLFYGYALPKVWYKSVLDNAADLIANKVTTLSVPGCLNNGGLIAVPLIAKKTPLPLAEFNTVEDDVITLARQPGSFTSAVEFYQGNVDLSGDVRYKTCIPFQGARCGEQRQITVKLLDCKVKADSGISVTSTADTFIYPSYFTMSGIIGK